MKLKALAIVALAAATAFALTEVEANPPQIGTVSQIAATAALADRAARPAAYKVRKGQTFPVYLTGYSFWDNTPPGSAAIARPVIRQRAGGTGTYRDPITIAVGHSFATGRQVLDFPPGTRFYIPALRRYAIVEDVCGDGPSPQNGPCHIGHQGMPWLDIYVDGRRAGQAAANACMGRITGVHEVIAAPHDEYPVVSGELTESGCRM